MNKYVIVCPRCGSTDVKQTVRLSGLLKIHCSKCNYESDVFPEVEKSKVKEFKKNIKKE